MPASPTLPHVTHQAGSTALLETLRAFGSLNHEGFGPLDHTMMRLYGLWLKTEPCQRPLTRWVTVRDWVLPSVSS